MADKVVRISAEDSGFSDAINRMGDNFRRAFGQTGFFQDDLLKEADDKFTKFSDKIKFIKDQLTNIKSANLSSLQDERDYINSRKGHSSEYKRKQILRAEADVEEQNKEVDKLIQSLDKFANAVDKDDKNRSRNGRSSGGSGAGEDKSYLDIVKDLASGNIGNAFRKVRRSGVDSIVRGLDNIGGTLGKSLLAIGGTIGAAIGVTAYLARQGYEDLRSENKLRAKVNVNESFADSEALATLGMSRSEFREFGSTTGLSRRTGSNLENETIRRMALIRGFGLDQGSVQGFDQFFQATKNGGNALDVNQNFDAIRTIQTILVRSEQQGLLGVSRGDFTMLPEKIAQVQGIMQMQFNNNERTDANSAVNLIMAGQQIGGRFADQRATEAFGRIDSSIKQPNGPGMRAFIFEMLRRSNPNANYTDIMAQMEGGATAQNLQAILPSIAKLPQGEMRRMVLYQFTKNWQDALRLDQSGNLDAMLKTLHQQPISDKESSEVFGATAERADKLNTSFDKWYQKSLNEFTEMKKKVAEGVDWIVKKGGFNIGPLTNPPKISSDTLRTNVITFGSTTGVQTKSK